MANINLTANYQQFASTPEGILVSDPFNFDPKPDGQGLSSADLIHAIEFSLEDTDSLFESDAGNEAVKNDTFIGFMGLAEAGSGSLEPLLDRDRLMHAAGRAFQALLAGVAWEVLLSNSSDALTTIDVCWPMDRLVINEPIAWAIIGLFAALRTFSAALAFTSTPGLDVADPGSIGSLVAILVHSTTLRRLTRASNTAGPRDSKARKTKKIGWWRPLSLKPWWLCLSISLTLALAGVLEVLQHVSDAKSGFSTVANLVNGQILARVVPAVLALLVARLVSSIDANILIFAPFAALRQGMQPPEVLSHHLLTKTTPIALYYSIKFGYWGAFCIAIAVIIGTFLPVAASGLYVLEVVPYQTPILASRQDFFNLTSVIIGQAEVAAILSLIERQEQPYPSNSYDGIALPSLRLDGEDRNFTGPVTIMTPVTRPTLDCDLLPARSFEVEYSFMFDYGIQAQIPFYTDWSCENDFRVYTNSTEITVYLSGTKHLTDPTDEMYWGQINSYNYTCASFDFIFGHIAVPCVDLQDGQQCHDNHNMTVVLCSQQIQEVLARVTYTDSTLTTIDPNHPPVINESSAVLVQNSNGGTSFPYRFQMGLDSTFQAWDPINMDGDTPYTLDQPFDAFFQMATRGADGVPPEQMLGPDNVDRLRRRVLQVCAGTGACRATAGAGAVAGTASAPRVRQDAGSKVALQVLLGLMALPAPASPAPATCCAATPAPCRVPRGSLSTARWSPHMQGARGGWARRRRGRACGMLWRDWVTVLR